MKKKNTISKELLKAWQYSTRRGDVKTLTEVSGIRPDTIRKALKTGECQEDLKNIITGFFESRIRAEQIQAQFLKANKK